MEIQKTAARLALGDGVGYIADWYQEIWVTKRTAAYLGCSYIELDTHPLRAYYIDFVSAAMEAEAEAERIKRELAIKP